MEYRNKNGRVLKAIAIRCRKAVKEVYSVAKDTYHGGDIVQKYRVKGTGVLCMT